MPSRYLYILFFFIFVLYSEVKSDKTKVPESSDLPLNHHNDCVPRNTVFLILIIVCGVHLMIIVGCWMYNRHTTLTRFSKDLAYEVESPPRAYYPELSVTRKRSPNKSDEYLDMSC